MSSWTFFDFVNVRGENEIHKWLNSSEVTKQAKAKINARIATLRGFPVFPEQYFSAYKGWDDIYELRIVYGNVQYLPLGCYGPGPRQFCLLVGGIEKGKIPKSLLSIAKQRRSIVISNPNSVCPHDFN